MTVRVNKSSFNIREKLSELGRKFGLKGSELVAAETVQEARDLVSAGRKNLIINGNMMISQRGTSFTVNGSANPYTLDRWAVRRGSISSLTVTKNTSTGLDSHPNALKIECTADASQAAGTDTWIRYGVEDVDSNSILNYPNSNKSLTLSFWVRANTAGQYSASITSGDFGDRFIHAFTVNANTWEYKSVTVPPPSQWGTTNGYGLRVYFDLGSGSNYQSSTLDQWIYGGSTYAASGNTRVTGVNGRTFEVTGIQLEVGRNATEFEHRPYSEELALCQRYFQKKKIGYGRIAHFRTDGIMVFAVDLPVTMRGSSTNTITQDTGLNQWAFRDGVSPTISSIQTNNSSYDGSTLSLLYSVSSGGTADETCFYYGGGSLLIDAEL